MRISTTTSIWVSGSTSQNLQITGSLIVSQSITAESFGGGGSSLTGIPMSKAISIINPIATEDITLFYTRRAITISEMNTILSGSGDLSINWTTRHDTNRTGSGTEIITGGTVSTISGSIEIIKTFNDATIPSGSMIWLETNNEISGSIGEFHLDIEYSYD